MMTVDDYLGIPVVYGQWLGGLAWSPNGEAVEFLADEPEIGLTFAMSGEIARFLEGFPDGSFLHFAFVLHLMSLLGCGGRPGTFTCLAHGSERCTPSPRSLRATHSAWRSSPLSPCS
jgi:hypothetical protein